MGLFDRLKGRKEPEHFLGKAAAAVGAGRVDEAVRLLRQMVDTDPGNAGLWYIAGTELALRVGRPGDGLQAFDRALQLGFDDPGCWCNRGICLAMLERVEEGLDSFDRALALAPGMPVVLSMKGYALNDLGRYAEALACFEEALRADPEENQTFLGRSPSFGAGLAAFGTGDRGGAASHLRAFLARRPAGTERSQVHAQEMLDGLGG